MKRMICAALCIVLACFSACGKQTDVSSGQTASSAASSEASAGIAEFVVSSDDLHNGVWDTVITNTANGKNVSPQLSWEAVEGAECYVVYMVDTSAGNWLHWRAGNITETSLERGIASDSEYIGPYPPSGTHNYEIYVYALKGTTERVPGALDCSNDGFGRFMSLLDESCGVIACGHITGTYTHGD